jgi:hypothetical protein
MNTWIKCSDRLPEEGRYVLVHVCKDNWIDSNDPEGPYYKVASLKKGISLEQRDKMKRGELPDPVEFGRKRSSIHSGGDEGMNNQVPYEWSVFGPGNLFGQDVDYWMEIERIK